MLRVQQGVVLLAAEPTFVSTTNFVQVVATWTATWNSKQNRVKRPWCTFKGSRTPLSMLLVKTCHAFLIVHIGHRVLQNLFQRIVDSTLPTNKVLPAVPRWTLWCCREDRRWNLSTDLFRHKHLRNF
eukprot:CAMPEP_0172901316 /NCGR_PEP_ID=MMETSP1075-20121228/166020_1 /TAXON_ID=2916 /ORGANISM="Ceratium fusus, Strain PA161109" /LENGTH=126 /DNA_ID=CAMNT_0013757687 /DNA_START=284 /DNA_END=664 /DNA_ORIENTATION=-